MDQDLQELIEQELEHKTEKEQLQQFPGDKNKVLKNEVISKILEEETVPLNTPSM